MDELIIDDKKYLSSKQAAKITGYAKDYVGQLCREGRVEARLVGRSWYVLESSIRQHRFEAEQADQSAAEAEEVSVQDPYRESTSAQTFDREPQANPEARSNSTYITEEPVMLPELNEKDELEAKNEPKEAAEPAENMQTVWHEWFNTRRAEPDIVEEAAPGAVYEPVEDVEAAPIAVHRDYTTHTTYAESEAYQEQEVREEAPVYEAEEAVEEDFPRPIRTRRARSFRMNYTLIRAGVIGFTIIVVGITAVSLSVNEDNRALFGGSSSVLDLLSGVYYAQK